MEIEKPASPIVAGTTTPGPIPMDDVDMGPLQVSLSTPESKTVALGTSLSQVTLSSCVFWLAPSLDHYMHHVA